MQAEEAHATSRNSGRRRQRRDGTGRMVYLTQARGTRAKHGINDNRSIYSASQITLS